MTINVNGLFPGELSPTRVLAGCINIFENVWPNTHETIDAIEEECLDTENFVNWHRAGTIGSGTNQNKRTNYIIGITEYANQGSIACQNVHNQFYILLLSSTIPYAQRYGIDEMYHEPYNMLKYSGGQEYKAHSDGETFTGRSLSAILYLNDDFSGGEIEFVNFNIKIKPKPGMLILFPSNYAYTHIAHPVTVGKKYAIVTWIKDRLID